MLRLLVPVFALVWLPSALSAQVIIHSRVAGKSYDIDVTEALAKSPAWAADAENPPLSARKAIASAAKMRDAVVKDLDGYDWEVAEAGLRPDRDEKWFWEISYVGRKSGMSGPPPILRLVVVMDGTAIKPTVKDAR